MVTINNVRYHAESIGILIEPQTPVVVVAVRANRIVVKPASLVETGPSQQTPTELLPPSGFAIPSITDLEGNVAQASAKNSGEPGENGDRLDFEIPED